MKKLIEEAEKLYKQIDKAQVHLINARINNDEEGISKSVMRLTYPLWMFWLQIWRGLAPIAYKIDKNPDWKVFLNILEVINLYINYYSLLNSKK